MPPAGGRAPEGRLGASGRSPEAQAPKGRYAGRRVRRQSRAARPAPQAWPGWQGWPERRRPGRRGGRPHSPHIVGAGPPRSTCAATGTGEEQCKAGPSARPAGAWPCIAEGCPRATAAAQLDRAGAHRGPALGRTFPGLPQAGRAGGGTAAAQGGQGERPAGRRGGWDVARPQAGRGREPLTPGRYTARENKRGSAHRALPLGFAD